MRFSRRWVVCPCLGVLFHTYMKRFSMMTQLTDVLHCRLTHWFSSSLGRMSYVIDRRLEQNKWIMFTCWEDFGCSWNCLMKNLSMCDCCFFSLIQSLCWGCESGSAWLKWPTKGCSTHTYAYHKHKSQSLTNQNFSFGWPVCSNVPYF